MKNNSNENIISFKWNLKDFIDLIQIHVKSQRFASLFDIKTVLTIRLVCRNFSIIFDRSYLEMVIRLGNLENSLRTQFWFNKLHCKEYILYIFIGYKNHKLNVFLLILIALIRNCLKNLLLIRILNCSNII